MGKYTQTIYEYMESINLDPFSEKDQIEAGRSLLSVEYDVPIEVMDTLLQRFIVRYINNEVGFSSMTKFRMELMKYAIQRRPWYEKMYNVFEQSLPYEFTDMKSNRNLSQEDFDDLINEVKNEIQSTFLGIDGLTGIKTYGRVTEDVGNVKSIAKGVRSEIFNKDNVKESGDSVRGHNISTDLETENSDRTQTGGKRDTHHNTISGTDTTTTSKGGKDTTTSDNRNAHGFGSINDLAEPGLMVDNSDVKTGTDVTDYNSNVVEELDKDTREDGFNDITHNEKIHMRGGKSNRKDSYLNENRSKGAIEKARDNNKYGRQSLDNLNRESKIRESTKHSNRSDRSKDEARETDEIRDTFQARSANSKLNENITVEGRVMWKPELLREFYDLFIVVDEEWVRDTRDLFSYIY